MKALSISILIALIAIGMVSCRSKAISIEPAENNPKYNISYLFEHDGVKVYRFIDGDRYVYFTNCGGEVTSIENDSIQTVTQTVKRPVASTPRP